MNTLQYQESDGKWADCNDPVFGTDRTNEFLTRCEKTTGKTRNEIIAILESGKTVRNDREDWYSNCRYTPDLHLEPKIELVKCSCGHSVPSGSVMGASMGSSCPDCYDRMSD